MTKDQIKKLSAIVGAENVCTDAEELSCFAAENFVKGFAPACKVKVKDGFEIEKLVKLANDEDLKLIPVSSKSKHTNGGTVPAVKNVVMVDLTGMTEIYDVDRTFRMTVIEAGVTYEQIIPALKEQGLMLDMPFAPKANKSVLADLIENTPRLNPMMQWNVMDPLRATEVIWGDGNRFRTGEAANMPMNLEGKDVVDFAHSKHLYLIGSNGPALIDYYRLIARSQGTMGIVPWASVKCALLPDLKEAYFAPTDCLTEAVEFLYQMAYLRAGDGLFLLNKIDFAALMAKNAKEAAKLAAQLPEWIATAVIASRPPLPEMRLAAQKELVEQAAAKANIRLTRQLAGIRADEVMDKAFAPCAEGKYWKDTEKGNAADIFFLCTMDRAKEFIGIVNKVADEAGYAKEELGVLIQPKHQGTSCSLEIRIPYDKKNEAAAEKLFNGAIKPLVEAGAFFSKPYGAWAKEQLPVDQETTKRLVKLKGIFDPKNVMNPGRLSDWVNLEK